MASCPVCKWEVSRSLEEHIRQRHPIINIDTHSFQLISKNLSDSYLLVKIKNVHLNFTFIIYRSNSHGGIFRLCTKVLPGSSALYKGDTDYTTQTFIHIELQKFIVENHANLLVDDTLNISSCPVFFSKINPNEEKSLLYTQLIDNGYYDRRYKNEILDKLVGIDCGSGFSNVRKIIGDILQMNDLPSIYRLQQKIMHIINPSFDINTLSRRPSASPLLSEYDRLKPGIDIKKRIMRIYLEYISVYLNSEFTVLPETKRGLYRDIFTIPKIEGVEIQMAYYSVLIKKHTQDIESNNYFTVIYALYNIISPIHKELNGRYSIVFNIIPMKNQMKMASPLNINRINRIGLYRYYMSTGIYLCKIFDYSSQVRDIAGKSYGDYLFLGDLYTNLFPVNKLYN
jgi:hypothetical protein